MKHQYTNVVVALGALLMFGITDVRAEHSDIYENSSKGYNISYDGDGNDEGIIFLAFKSFTDNDYALKINDSYYVENPDYGSSADYYVLEIGNGTDNVKIGTSSRHSNVTSLEIACTKLEAINANAFSEWTSLTTLTISAPTTSVPTLGDGALPSNLTKIVVPADLLSAYATADGWKDYVSILEDENGNKYTTTAVTEVGADEEITVKGNVIYLTNATKVRVVDLAGRNVYKGTTDKVVLAGKGIFIVATENCAKRVVVR